MGNVTELKAMPPPKPPAKKKAGELGETVSFTGKWYGRLYVDRDKCFSIEEFEKCDPNEILRPVRGEAEESYNKLFNSLDELQNIRSQFYHIWDRSFTAEEYISNIEKLRHNTKQINAHIKKILKTAIFCKKSDTSPE